MKPVWYFLVAVPSYHWPAWFACNFIFALSFSLPF